MRLAHDCGVHHATEAPSRTTAGRLPPERTPQPERRRPSGCLGCVARCRYTGGINIPHGRVSCVLAPRGTVRFPVFFCALGEVAVRARVFIDFWNFQLGWNEVSGDSRCDWRAVPRLLVHEAEGVLATTGGSDTLTVEETIVHASVNQTTETKLSDWLTNWLDRQPSFDVKIRSRRTRKRPIYCKACGATATNCPSCQAPLAAAVEKGVDAALVTDLLSLAWQRAYDVAVLVSGDADYIPAVEHVQAQGLKVINAAWRSKGHELRAACWGSFDIDGLILQLKR